MKKINVTKIYNRIPISNKDNSYNKFILTFCNYLVFEDVVFTIDTKSDIFLFNVDESDESIFYEILYEVINDIYLPNLEMDAFLDLISLST